MIPILMLIASGSACHAVSGDRITAADLAAVSSAFATLAPDTPVGYAPEPGDHRVLEPADLLRIANANGLELHSTTPVCFERTVMPLDGPVILNALRASLKRTDAEIEVLEFSKFSVPPGKIVFPMESFPSHSMANVAIWNGYVDFNNR